MIDPGLAVTQTAKDIIFSLCEVGWLYCHVDQYAQKTEDIESSGLTAQAFGYTIQVT